MTEPNSAPVGRRRNAWFVVLFLAAVGVGWWLWSRGDSAPSGPERLARSESRYLNASTEVEYIGRAACAECHPDAHATYEQTTHSRAFGLVDPSKEPPGGHFRHKLSGLNYRIYRKDGALRIAEDLPLEDGTRHVLVDRPMKFVAGSGSNSRSYVLPIDGFLVEAPMTWYTKRKAWGMSPGYDRVDHHSFSRPVDAECLFCHVGWAERVGRSTHRLRILEDAIGCERCHGPGGLHAEKWRSGAEPTGETDLTIVNPVDLDPAAQLDLCGQCHLDHTLSVPVRGREMTDWRPGLPMREFRTTYRLEASNARMSVVGHVGQLRKSRCFQASGTMTCLSCHDPHDTPAEEDVPAYYRKRCLSCHDTDACGVGHGDPRRAGVADDCVACHMPKSDTDIPHFSFTHHRVAIHGDAPDVVDASAIHTLIPAGSIAHLPQADRDRGLGLAYLLLANRRPDDPDATDNPPDVVRAYTDRALKSLERAYAGGVRDAAVESNLAFLYELRKDPLRASKHGLAALDRTDASPSARVFALAVLARTYRNLGQHERAVRMLKKLVKLRRDAEDWGRLGESQFALGDHRAALASAQQAAAISPHRPEIQRFLARAYELDGQVEKAAHHARVADRLAARRSTSAPR